MTARLTDTDIDRAAALLRDGGLVALPTETVYGLAAVGLDAVAVARIFAAKERPLDNPVILHVADVDQAWPLWRVDARCRRRVEALTPLWPGPLTLVLPATDRVPPAVTAGMPSVAVRVPAHPVTLAILSALDLPVAAPSANRSGRPSPTTADHVLATLDGRIDAVVDGGPCAVGVESTVLDLTGPVPRVLRPGHLTAEALANALGEPVHAYDPDHVGASPGLRHRHYAPAIPHVGRITDLDAAWCSEDALLLFAATAAHLHEAHGPRTPTTELLPDDPAGAARSLYAALYRLEQARPARLAVEETPPGPAWAALADRLGRAIRG